MASAPVYTNLILLVFWALYAPDELLATPIDTGESLTLQSTILNEERQIYVSVPSNYAETTHKYPVTYVLDAEFLFDVTRAVATLRASRSYMPESIIVGLPNNTNQRMGMALELTDNEGDPFFYGTVRNGAQKHLDFFENELFPFIEKNYRVNTHRTIIGMSPTYGPVLQSYWAKPHLFSGYIIVAGNMALHTSSGEKVGEKITKAITTAGRPITALYLGISGEDAKDNTDEAVVLDAVLTELEKTSPPNALYHMEILDGEEHYGMAPLGIQRGFDLIYPRQDWLANFNKYAEFWTSSDPAKSIETHYDALSTKYGFDAVPLEDGFHSPANLLGAVRFTKRHHGNQKAIEVLTLALAYYPNSAELHSQLATLYRDENLHAAARQSAQKALDLAAIYRKDKLGFYQAKHKAQLSSARTNNIP